MYKTIIIVQNKTQTQTQTQTQTLTVMFCKVCFDSQNSNYTGHNVKDYAGNTICPLLLNTKCLKCGYFGHTTKYCKTFSVVKVPIDRLRKNVSFKNIGVSTKSIKYLNTFALLCDDVSDDTSDDYCLDDIVWGKGTKPLIGIIWADYCDF